MVDNTVLDTAQRKAAYNEAVYRLLAPGNTTYVALRIIDKEFHGIIDNADYSRLRQLAIDKFFGREFEHINEFMTERFEKLIRANAFDRYQSDQPNYTPIAKRRLEELKGEREGERRAVEVESTSMAGWGSW